jgi:hypothetical protein
MALLEESTMQRASMFQEFMKQQQNEQKQRLDFDRDERAKDRDERAEERQECQQEQDAQTKLIANLLENIKGLDWLMECYGFLNKYCSGRGVQLKYTC